jgi:RNA polymerase sigma factor (sigma-70 family)
VSCNLRLVALVERRTIRGGEQIDRLQAGATGLIRGAEKFDPERGYKFSTYAYWWIRKGIDRAVEKMPQPSGVFVPTCAIGSEAAAPFERQALRLDGSYSASEEGTLADVIPDSGPAPDTAASMALAAMLAHDPDGLALMELQQIDGFRQCDLAELLEIGSSALCTKLSAARREFRRLPEVAAALM